MKYEVTLNIEGLKKEVKKTTVSNTKIGRSTPQKLVDFFQNLPQSFFVFNLFLTKNI